MYLKNRNISSKIKRSKVTDYAALNEYIYFIYFQNVWHYFIMYELDLFPLSMEPYPVEIQLKYYDSIETRFHN